MLQITIKTLIIKFLNQIYNPNTLVYDATNNLFKSV